MRPARVVAVLGACLALGLPRAGWALSEGEPAPAFSLPDLSGRTISLSDLARHKAVLLVFWASWDVHLREEMRIWEALARAYAPRGLQVAALNKAEAEQAARRAVGGPPPAFQVLLADPEVVRQYGVRGVPEAFVLDAKGTVRRRVAGYGPRMESNLRSAVERLLPTPKPAKRPGAAAEASKPAPVSPKPAAVSPKLARMRAYAHLRLGITHVELGDLLLRAGVGDDDHFDQAVTEFRQSIGFDPSNVDARIWLGAACERAHRLDEARQAYRDALGVDATNYYAREALRRLKAPAP